MAQALSRRGRPHASTKEQLERIAMDLFTRNGYSETTMDSIADVAGIGRSTLFRYAPSKAMLFWMNSQLYSDAFRRQLDGLSTDQEHPCAAIADTLRDALSVQMFTSQDVLRQKIRLLASNQDLQKSIHPLQQSWSEEIATVMKQLYPSLDQTPLPFVTGSVMVSAAFAVHQYWGLGDYPASAFPALFDSTLGPIAKALDQQLSDAAYPRSNDATEPFNASH